MAVSAVPYDFDFLGLVDSEYAGPSPKLPIRSVTQRLFRGFCDPRVDWSVELADIAALRGEIEALFAEVSDLSIERRTAASAYLERFFEIASSPEGRRREIIDACRSFDRRPD